MGCSFYGTQAVANENCNKTLDLLTQNWNNVSDMTKVCGDLNNPFELRQRAYQNALRALNLIGKIGINCKKTCVYDTESLKVCSDSDDSIQDFRDQLKDICN